ncbi:MAG: type IX secretion system outer membrane channel protein PorV [Bacteroidota bacterium]|nr:type IX secretion system outer membrane channel protein PorV [Bacteroidota bacterium]
MKIRFIVVLSALVLLSSGIYAQEVANPITTAVPFLLIAPDARAGAMGDVGVASSPDDFSLYWNPAKYAFCEKDFGVGIGYMPWLRGLVNDIGLASVSGYKKFGDRQAIGASLRFFSMGQVTFTDINGVELAEVKPTEWTIDATYSRKFTNTLSGAVSGRFIYSNLIPINYTDYDVRPGTSVAADVALYYNKELNIEGLVGSWFSFGLNISNIGAKMSYNSNSIQRDFIPTNLRLGPSFTMDIDEYNRLMFEVDFNKLLVPTPPVYGTDSLGNTDKTIISKGMNPDVSPITGMLQSFYDAPYGFKEELQEVSIAGAVEYWYNKLFAIRGGYFYESKYKGDRQYFTMGAGIRYNVFGLDFSYLVPVKRNNPLQNTMQFTLLFNFDQAGKKDKQNSGND